MTPSICERLREACLDWDGTPMPDGAEPRSVPNCGDMRSFATTIESQAALLRECREALDTIRTKASGAGWDAVQAVSEIDDVAAATLAKLEEKGA